MTTSNGKPAPHEGKAPNWAYLLIVGGLILLAGNLGVLGWVSDWAWGFVLLAGGAAFLYYYYRMQPRSWWALIPGFALAAAGVAALLADTGGPLFLALLGAGFAAVYATGRQRWWAVLPAGVLGTLAIVAWLGERAVGWDTGWVFFLGLAATFGALTLLPENGGRQRWAIYPAIGALTLALLTGLTGAVTDVLIPLLLVAAGAFLLWRRGGASRGGNVSH